MQITMPPDPQDHDSAPPIYRQFATTHWSAVQMAGRNSAPGEKEALENLCRAYWYPLYAYVRRKGHAEEDAKDLTQQFFARLLQGDRLALADPARGRFRTFLLSALNHFLINEWIKTGRDKRGGAVEFVSLHTGDPENLYTAEPADARTPETLYEQRWASAVMKQAYDRLAAEYRDGRVRLFEALKPFIWGDKAGNSYGETAIALGLNEGAVRVAVHRLRRSYCDLLREEIAQTVATPEEVDDELRYLIEIVSRAPM
jgi:RNA polymerase sigma factor (sigma-70 family)